MNELFGEKRLQGILVEIAREFQNRNLFPLIDFPQFVDKDASDDLSVMCTETWSIVTNLIKDKHVWEKLLELQKYDVSVSTAIEFGTEKEKIDLEKVSIYLCLYLLQRKYRSVDEYIENLENNSLCDSLGLSYDDEQLVNLSDKRLELRNHGIVFNKTTLLYPHEFFRRYYSSNFVGMPHLLQQAHEKGLDVRMRIDPFRKTSEKFYREIFEADYWQGRHFSDELLNDKYFAGKTVHTSSGYYNLIYEVKYTIFRTQLMQKMTREFMVEEYCPLELPHQKKAPGLGEKYYIQKFAHLCYDQEKKCFTHLDGAIRVFDPKEYEHLFLEIEAGRDVDDKAGKRHKMFLVEGEMDLVPTQELLTEWFRYNPHIQEYFSNVTEPPWLPYSDINPS